MAFGLGSLYAASALVAQGFTIGQSSFRKDPRLHESAALFRMCDAYVPNQRTESRCIAPADASLWQCLGKALRRNLRHQARLNNTPRGVIL